MMAKPAKKTVKAKAKKATAKPVKKAQAKATYRCTSLAISEKFVRATVNGKSYTLLASRTKTKTEFQKAVKAAKNNDWAEFISLLDMKSKYVAAERATGLKIRSAKGGLKFGNQKLDMPVLEEVNKRAEKSEGPEDDKAIKKFYDRLGHNPDENSKKMLFNFLKAGHFPILSDGHFVAYKKVREDFTDCHTGNFDNHPGKEVKMRREDCDSDPNHACSRGLHIGTYNHANGFGGAHLIAVKVDPADVVAVPNYDKTKMRVCRYFVLKEVSTPYVEEVGVARDMTTDGMGLFKLGKAKKKLFAVFARTPEEAKAYLVENKIVPSASWINVEKNETEKVGASALSKLKDLSTPTLVDLVRNVWKAIKLPKGKPK